MVRTYLKDTFTAFKTGGIKQGAKNAGRDLLFGLYHNLPISYGTPIFELDWDVLVILDGCRPDLIAEVVDQYEFLPSEIPTIYSVGSRSDTWMERNFSAEYHKELSRTAYVTGNPYSDSKCVERDFGLLDEVWRYAWDDELGTVPADSITDRGVAVGREGEFNQLIIHYMQPHFPSIPEPIAEGIDLETFGTNWNSVWDLIRAGSISETVVWESYQANLEYVLDSVRILLSNLDADRVVLTADHGNAFGEWGFYGHPINKPVPVLRRVPWILTKAEDRGDYQPDIDTNKNQSTEVKDRLRSLGYVN
jgi:hypothetical protein